MSFISNRERLLIIPGVIVLSFSAISFYQSSKDINKYLHFTGVAEKTWIEIHKQPDKNSFKVPPDSISYSEFNIKLCNSSSKFIIRNDYSSEFMIIKRLIDESNYLKIWSERKLHKTDEFIIVKLDTDKRINLISFEESKRRYKEKGLVGLIFGLIFIGIGNLNWFKEKLIDNDNFNYELYSMTLNQNRYKNYSEICRMLENKGLTPEQRTALIKLADEKSVL